jgi:Ca2+-binding RTX toxin-like protein
MSKYEHEHEEHDDDHEYDDHEYDDQSVNQNTNVTTIVNEVVVNEIVNEVIVNVIDNDTPDPITNYIYGTRRSDYLNGTDQNDFIYGYQKGDTLIDGLGADRLYGGAGKNTYTMTADGQVDISYIKRDKKVDTITSLGLEDRIDILGSNISFAQLDDGIGIYSKHRLQAIYTGDFTLEQIKTITI